MGVFKDKILTILANKKSQVPKSSGASSGKRSLVDKLSKLFDRNRNWWRVKIRPSELIKTEILQSAQL